MKGSVAIVTALNPTGYPWRVITVCVKQQIDTTNHTTERDAQVTALHEIQEARLGRNDITEVRILRWDIDHWELSERLTVQP